MSSSDAIVIGEDWISEHYFTTDAGKQSFQGQVQQFRKDWDAATTETVRSRFTAARRDLESALADLMSGEGASNGGSLAAASDLYATLRRVLGYAAPEYALTAVGPVIAVRAPGITEAAPLVIVEARPVDAVDDLLARDADTLLTGYPVDDKTTLISTARLLSTLFVDPEGPDFALVLAGRWALVAERERWAEGRYLAVDLQLVCERNDPKRGGEIDRALACLSAESLAPDADGAVWWAGVLAQSIKHTVGVSADLREGVRLSIEIIANEVVDRRRAQQLDPLPQAQAQPLAKQALRFLYRILFLLYAEASPELGVLPVGETEYEQGYGLDRLRDLTLAELASPKSRGGTHLYESLATLFRLVDRGHAAPATGADGVLKGLTFSGLKADLFHPAATALIDEVGLGNAAVQKVLRKLLLSKESRGRDRGFISYAELGINQLGAVYEGLMSYTGFFAETDLYEVAKNGDAAKGSWVVPIERAEGIAEADFVREIDGVTGESRAVLHRRGTFVFRLAGRERQQSASYYTPEVLTRFTVSQALAELLDQDGHTTTAEEILGLSVCEPALGSGAFAIEAVRQLAEEYLRRRQSELGTRIDPDAYAVELQRVKASIALHQVYGVDLNATAVELAEISLWLDTMVEGLQAPWFGLHLRRGNSLIGARHAVFTRSQVDSKKAWLSAMPRDIPLTEMPSEVANGREGSASGSIHHFLLPAEGWGAAIGAKEAKELAPEALDRLKQWRKSVLVQPSKKQVDALVGLGRRVEALWQLSWRRLTIAESEIRRAVDLWGASDLPAGGAVTRKQVETTLADPNGAYSRLHRVMDAWSAMWFWPLTETVSPPSLVEWIDTLQKLLGTAGTVSKASPAQPSLGAAFNWDELDDAEQNDLAFSLAADVRKTIDDHPWLAAAQRVAERQGFFHWELDFAQVFAGGGFSLQVGNPPWVRPRSDVEALLAEADPWWQLKAKSTAMEDAEHRAFALSVEGTADLVLDGTSEVVATAAVLGSRQQYPHLLGLQPDLYRCFMAQTWRHAESTGSVGLIHPETHFTDEKAGLLRATTYRRLRRHWQFINELVLFEIHDLVRYGIHIYGSEREPDFLQATSLYHPDTVRRSLEHDGSGTEPGLKDPDSNWDLRPHASRIQHIRAATLHTWHAILESNDQPTDQTRMVYTVNRSTAAVLEKLSNSPRMAALGMHFSRGWDESVDRKKGYFDADWGVPESWDAVILQGPHLHVATPMYKAPNPSMLHNQDWTLCDLEALPATAIPATSYKPRGNRECYDAAYTSWRHGGSSATSARDHFRLAYRAMAANTGERTLIPALIPPGTAHVNVVFSFGAASDEHGADLLTCAGFCSSLLADLSVRVTPKSNIYQGVFERLPIVVDHPLTAELRLRAMRLNALTSAFEPLWRRTFERHFQDDAWTCDPSRQSVDLGAVGPDWSSSTPLRRAIDRRQALLEIDALVALMLGVTPEQLCTIYRTQFAVLCGYDRTKYIYDADGRVVPTSVLTAWRKRGDNISVEERTATHPGSGVRYEYVPPFRTLDREADLRSAYSAFEALLARR